MQRVECEDRRKKRIFCNEHFAKSNKYFLHWVKSEFATSNELRVISDK